jgi:hypothetical protein
VRELKNERSRSFGEDYPSLEDDFQSLEAGSQSVEDDFQSLEDNFPSLEDNFPAVRGETGTVKKGKFSEIDTDYWPSDRWTRGIEEEV